MIKELALQLVGRHGVRGGGAAGDRGLEEAFRRGAAVLSDPRHTFASMTVGAADAELRTRVRCTSGCDSGAALSVGEHVRVLRLAAGLTQQQLAERARTTQPVIARLEGDAILPTLRTLEKLAKALGQDLHLLVPGTASNEA